MLNLIRLRSDLTELLGKLTRPSKHDARGFIVAPRNPSLRCFFAQGGAVMAN